MSQDRFNDDDLPSFSSRTMPTANINFDMDDDDIGEETTRRIGGSGFAPSFAPVSFDTPPAPAFHQGGPSFSSRPQKAGGQGHSPMVRSRTDRAANASVWSLTDVPVLPEFHPLEKTAVFVPFSSPAEVAARLSDVLRERSIQANYDSAKAKVQCMTADSVDFRIRLYRGRSKYSHGIIVEVQRRFGTSVDFHETTKAILDSAEGNVPAPPAPLGSSGSLPLVEDDDENDGYGASSSSSNGASSLGFIGKLLSHPGEDAHSLALQTLSSFTNPAKMGRKTAQSVSTVLLEPGNEIARKVLTIAAAPKGGDNLRLRLLAMTVVANAVRSATGAVNGATKASLRPILLAHLQDADNNAQLAFLAARCAEYTVSSGDVDASEIGSLLQQAKVVGESKHAALRDQAARCLRKMNL